MGAEGSGIAVALTDGALWSRAQAGDQGAFEDLYRRHVRAVAAYLSRRLPSQDVDDVTASVFLEAWRHRDDVVVDEHLGLLPWLLGVARNLARGFYRRAAHVPVPSEPNVVDGARLVHATSDDLGDVAVQYESAEQAALDLSAALAALASLPDRDQIVLDLVVIEGLSPSDAARVLGVNPVTLRSRLHRARTRLAAAFARQQAAHASTPLPTRAISHGSES